MSSETPRPCLSGPAERVLEPRPSKVEGAVASLEEARRGYRRSLSDWAVTETSVATFKVKAPASTEGLSIYCYVTGGAVMLEIESLYCPEDYYCMSTGP
jgi:hypothetical protein